MLIVHMYEIEMCDEMVKNRKCKLDSTAVYGRTQHVTSLISSLKRRLAVNAFNFKKTLVLGHFPNCF
jgi:hypothetical protein